MLFIMLSEAPEEAKARYVCVGEGGGLGWGCVIPENITGIIMHNAMLSMRSNSFKQSREIRIQKRLGSIRGS